MTKEEIVNHLWQNRDERGIKRWVNLNYPGLSTFGIGLTKLKYYAKKIKKNHELALELWNSEVYDLRIISILVEEPKKVTPEQVESQVKELDFWMASHAYCSSLLSKVDFAEQLADKWLTSKDNVKRRCGYLLVFNFAMDKKHLPDEYFGRILKIIEKELQSEENFVKEAMNCALLKIGMRNRKLKTHALAVAKKIGKVDVDYGDNSCQAFDCVKHLSSDRVKKLLKD